MLTSAQSGKLRLTRTGAELTYSVAVGENGEFQEIHKARDWGTEDVGTVRVAAEAANSPAVLDVLLKDLSIKADSVPIASAPPSRPIPQFAVVGGLVVLVLAAGCCAWVWRRSQNGSAPRRAKP